MANLAPVSLAGAFHFDKKASGDGNNPYSSANLAPTPLAGAFIWREHSRDQALVARVMHVTRGHSPSSPSNV